MVSSNRWGTVANMTTIGITIIITGGSVVVTIRSGLLRHSIWFGIFAVICKHRVIQWSPCFVIPSRYDWFLTARCRLHGKGPGLSRNSLPPGHNLWLHFPGARLIIPSLLTTDAISSSNLSCSNCLPHYRALFKWGCSLAGCLLHDCWLVEHCSD